MCGQISNQRNSTWTSKTSTFHKCKFTSINRLQDSECVSWSVRLNEEVEYLKKCCNLRDLQHTNSYRCLRTCKGKEVATKRWSHCALEIGSDRNQIHGIKLKNSITLAQSFCARFGIPYTSVLLSLCKPYNWSSHKISPLNPGQTFTSYFSEIYFNTTLSYMPNYPNSFFPECAPW